MLHTRLQADQDKFFSAMVLPLNVIERQTEREWGERGERERRKGRREGWRVEERERWGVVRDRRVSRQADRDTGMDSSSSRHPSVSGDDGLRPV